MAPSAGRTLDYDDLAEALAALAYPARLELLDKLRAPHALSEIRLAPRRRRGSAVLPGAASRQAVWSHLAQLERAELVRTEKVDQDGRAVQRYVVNAGKLYALTEEFRRLSLMHAASGAAPDATGTMEATARPEPRKGPRLVLVHGVYEGKAFDLDPRLEPAGGWVLGRRRGLPVCLDYDPFVSQENAVITAEGGRHVLRDLEGSKNGTAVNWRRLPGGGAHVLEASDVIGVGRSLLMFAR